MGFGALILLTAQDLERGCRYELVLWIDSHTVCLQLMRSNVRTLDVHSNNGTVCNYLNHDTLPSTSLEDI